MLTLKDCFDPEDYVEAMVHRSDPEKLFALNFRDSEDRGTAFLNAQDAKRLAQWLLLHIEEGDL